VVGVRDGDLVLPYSASMLARVLATAGLATDEALAIAVDVGAALDRAGMAVADLDDVRAATAEHLRVGGQHETLRRLQVRWWIRSRRRPLVLAVGGTSGVGKSTVSRAAAEVLGIEAVLSTDLVRAVLRGTLHPDLVPALSGSSFSAARMFRSTLAGNPLLAAFEQQAALVGQATVPLVRRALKEGMQVVVNGVHLVPTLVDVPADWPVFSYALSVPDLDEHQRRFQARFARSDRDPQRYLSRIEAIRELDEHIVAQSRAAGIPVIESRELAQTVSELVGAICTDLDRAFAITPAATGRAPAASPSS
jgi:2-phosphoglycerate kinase